MDEIAWLRDQMDEDERVAHECLQAPADRLGVQLGTYRWEAREDGVWCREYLVAPRVSDEDGAHIARWDPARVLAEIEAKRRMLDWCERVARIVDEVEVWSIDTSDVVEALAQPYAGRPGFPEAWR